ncbi:MAG: alpha-ketoacid dehydrogenase subunit beta [Verrucomicrobia bacterium]|jgi:acetoin:2,6-dichlorophenolindophenol oxidoreductase subunit beta|nr:alpha-ketoacid dehydrogenase subunit beta [Verrucomicrobiota bacterium]MBT7068637.1 alpha-ketoacid dehydrogenase subunit beta [Verrucomicrobiota bacterium]MBT7701019.1 alpha-ketoacid dehydrogenase subunit beta [Verrucomicrobiota bacterium]
MPVITFGEAIKQAYREEMQRDKNVFLMGEDVGRWGSLYRSSTGLLEEFGSEQIKDAPISEAAIAGCGVGSALMGMRPIVEFMYIDFISIAMDQIVNHAAKWHQLSNGKIKLPMVIKTQGGAGRRNSSQHSQSLENWFVNVPGLITVMPSTPYDVKGLLKSAIRNDNPVVFIEHKCLYFDKQEVPEEEYLIPLGKADVKRTGDNVTIIATSWMVSFALQAAETLADEGISCEVIDPRTLWPLDKETIIQSVKKTGLCLVVTEAPAEGGWSGEASSVVHEHCFSELKKPVKRHCSIRTGIPYGATLEREVIPGAESIAGAVRELTNAPSSSPLTP